MKRGPWPRVGAIPCELYRRAGIHLPDERWRAGCQGGVVPLDRPVTGAVDQSVGHDECRDEIEDAIVLGNSPVHFQYLLLTPCNLRMILFLLALGVYRVFDASLSSSKPKYSFLFFCICLAPQSSEEAGVTR